MVNFLPNSMLIFAAFGSGISSNAVRIGSNDANLRFKRFILRFRGPTKPILADFGGAILTGLFHDFFQTAESNTSLGRYWSQYIPRKVLTFGCEFQASNSNDIAARMVLDVLDNAHSSLVMHSTQYSCREVLHPIQPSGFALRQYWVQYLPTAVLGGMHYSWFVCIIQYIQRHPRSNNTLLPHCH